MALSSNAMTTLGRVKRELGIDKFATTNDDMIERAISTASSSIEAYCDRTFGKQTGIVENKKGFGSNRLYLDVTPVISIASIAIRGTTLDNSSGEEYELESGGAGSVWRDSGWPWTAQRRPDIVRDPWPGTEKQSNIVVTYTGGFVLPKDGAAVAPDIALPLDLQEACAELAALIYLQRGKDRSITRESLMSASVTYDRGSSGGGTGSGIDSGIPLFIRSKLNFYRRGVRI